VSRVGVEIRCYRTPGQSARKNHFVNDDFVTLFAAFFEVDGGVVEVVIRVHEDHFAIFFAQGLFDFAWDSGYEGVWGDDGVLGDDGSGGDDGAFSDAGVVEDDGADADEDGVFEDAAVDGGVVADGDHLADDDGVFVAHSVEDDAVLDVAAGADADGVYVPPYYGVHPDARLVTEDDVTDDLCGGVDVATGGNYRKNSLVTPDHGVDCIAMGAGEKLFSRRNGLRG
jgi:hypothetical protein